MRIQLISNPAHPKRLLDHWRGWVFALLVCLLAAQWLGLVHRISHHNHEPITTAQAYGTHAHNAGHHHWQIPFSSHEKDRIECQLFDALTLTGILTNNAVSFSITNLFTQSLVGIAVQTNLSVTQQHYQSRAPPLQTL